MSAADETAIQALSTAGAFCGECGFQPGDRGCPDCERCWAGYVKALRAAGWAARAEVADEIDAAQATKDAAEVERFGTLDHESVLMGEAVRAVAAHLREMPNVASSNEPAPVSDFFQPGHTYYDAESAKYDWKFRCDTVTTHPEDGERTALGWRFFNGQWQEMAYGEDDWEINQYVGVAVTGGAS
ncbi:MULTISPECIES: hypothetical protein [Streptomyces]|uniref:Uncharacterized protein n=2 Tax=Streptomyces TaxID=1883 RepID=A0A1E7LJN9_9ACTN|nr:hypothetical protein [Streptomyces nanshensis]OEV16374.1 hypothetical protein AN221_32760 [Streptomyces nanshensis]